MHHASCGDTAYMHIVDLFVGMSLHKPHIHIKTFWYSTMEFQNRSLL